MPPAAVMRQTQNGKLSLAAQSHMTDVSVSLRSARWDLRLPSSDSACSAVCDAAVARVTPIIEELHSLPLHPDSTGIPLGRGLVPPRLRRPKMVMTGTIVSRRGARAQGFHADASETHHRIASKLPLHRLFNVFCPLVDIAKDGDGTQFWPGSHLEARSARFGEAIKQSGSLWPIAVGDEYKRELEAPACPAGGIILFDMRLIHRGLPNAGRERTVLYTICATGGARDRVNFPESPSESVRVAVDTMLPRDDAEALRETRESIRSYFPTWDYFEQQEGWR
uniref:Phytanoyl-CoA dioxygenase family protein n=1 Tax=Prymnesium polylepis TaxID=72548 RepID=A0A7S4IJV0_9EUKA|mmetsp:Transcript_32504/g.80676  ORF Transcript_32504/g.80676 Transcript_32504/m.80676 type:complete len:280 (+) Transcript_32504:292-1131(+)